MASKDLFDMVKDIVAETVNADVVPLIKEIEKKCNQKSEGEERFKLKGVIRQKFVYVAGFSKKTTAADVGAYLEKKWPKVHFTVNDMRIKSYYSAFKIGFTQLSYDEMRDLKNWPEGLKIEIFRVSRKGEEEAEQNKQEKKLFPRVFKANNDENRQRGNGNKKNREQFDSAVPISKENKNQENKQNRRLKYGGTEKNNARWTSN